MADVEITSFRENVETEIDKQGRVVRQKGRQVAPARSSATNSALAMAIHQKLDVSRHEVLRGAGGGSITVTIGRVREERPVFHPGNAAKRLARELGSLK